MPGGAFGGLVGGSRGSGGFSGELTPDGPGTHPDDVPDPHVLGMALHAQAYEQIASSTQALARLLREVAPQD